MKKIIILLPLVALSSAAQASTSYGALGNFDAVNDTGQRAYGFEIEIDDVHSTAIGGTFSYNHYGAPKIREDNTDPAHPKVFVRYEVAKPSGLPTGLAAGYTEPAVPGAISPTNGHMCTNPGVNQGCEHFGVGIYSSSYSTVKYNWLIKVPDVPSGTTTIGPAVNVGTPTWTYQAPVVIPNPIPAQPPIVQFPAQVVAVIPAPVVPIPPAKQFGEPSWVKVIKTTSHNTNPIPLEDLVGDYKDENGVAPLKNWANGEPAEVESEWYLLQTNNAGRGNKAEKPGNPDNMGDMGDETVTRRYEFYAYVGPDVSIDGENGEAMCDNVQTDPTKGIVGNGIGTVGVTQFDPSNPGETITVDVDCSQYPIVGEYRGAQMGAFNAVAPFGLIDNIQNGNVAEAFPNRTVATGGNTPYVTNISAGALPNGLGIASSTGILSGTPSKVGVFNFSVSATDFDGKPAVKAYTVKVTGPGDVDVDSDIDSADLAIIKANYGQPAAAKDPSDVNGDLKINILDYRKAASLCTMPKCALITPAP